MKRKVGKEINVNDLYLKFELQNNGRYKCSSVEVYVKKEI